MEVRRIGPGQGLVGEIKDLRKRIQTQETRPAGSIVIRETVETVDPDTGVKTILGKLPDGSYGIQPFVYDITPPPVATAPIVTADPGVISVTWDGLFIDNGELPRDFECVNIIGHKMNGSTTVSSTPVGMIRRPLDFTYLQQDIVPVGETWQFSLEAEDYNGNRAVWSARSASVTMLSVATDAEVNAALEALQQATTDAQNAADTAQGAADTAQQAADNAAQAVVDLGSITGTIYTQSATPSANSNSLWIDTAHNNVPRRYLGKINRRALVANLGGGASIGTRLSSLGYAVSAVSVLPTFAQASGYDLVAFDAGYAGLGPATNTLAVQLLDRGVSIYTSGNDTTSLPYLFTGGVTRGTPKNPIRPIGTHPASQGWAQYSDTDLNFYLTGIDPNATVTGVTLVGSVDQPLNVVREHATTFARWAHVETYATPVDVLNAHINWVADNWVAVQDQAIISAASAAASAQAKADTAFNNAQTAATAAGQAQQTADGKNTSYYLPAAPAGSGFKTGDQWFDTSNNYALKVWNGSSWVTAQDSALAKQIADSKALVYTQATVPPVEARVASTVWYDTSLGLDKIVQKYWNGSAWTAVADKTATDAAAVADSKGETIYSSTEPVAAKRLPQNTWVDTTGGLNVSKRWDGYNWVAAGDSRISSSATAVTAADAKAQNALDTATSKGITYTQAVTPPVSARLPQNIWNDTSLGLNNIVVKYWDGSAWTALADKAATDATALATSKGETIYSSAEPTVAQRLTQNLWIDTTGGLNIQKRWNGTAWVVVADSRIDSATAAASAAQQTADSKALVYTQSTVPPASAQVPSTIWNDTSLGLNNVVVKYWNGSAWTSLADKAATDAAAAANTAQTSATNAMNAQSYSINASFDDWTGTLPAGYNGFGTTVGVVTKETGILRKAPYAARFTLDSTTQSGFSFSSNLNHAPNLEYFTVEVDLYLVSGTLGGAGMILDWSGTGMTNNRTQINFINAITAPVTGKWYRVSQVLRRPANITGTWNNMSGYLMGSWTGHGTLAAKTIIYDWLNIRPSSAEEILAYLAPTDAQAKADTAQQNAITAAGDAAQVKFATVNANVSAVSATTATKTKSYFQPSQPSLTGNTTGDLWFDTDDNNKVYIWNGTWAVASDQRIEALNTSVSAAQQSANGKNKVIYSTSPASGTTGYTAGDTWFQRDSVDQTKIIAQWEFTTSWQSRQLNHQVVASIDAAKISVGTLDVANRIAANSIAVNKLTVGDFTNLAIDGNFTDLTKKSWTGSGTVVTETNAPNKITVVTAASGNNDQANINTISVTGGEQIYGECWVYGEPTNVGGGGPNMHMVVTTNSGGVSWPTFMSTTRAAVSGQWVKLSGSITMPANAKTAKVELAVAYSADAVGNTYHFREVVVRRKNTGELIVDGAIKANSAIIENGAIGAAQIGSVNANTITVGYIQGNQISATAIDGKTITGALIQTDSTPLSAARGIKLSSTELAGYDASGVKNFSLTSGGSLTLKGAITSGSTISGATLTGSGIETTTSTNRGIKIQSSGVSAYDGSGNMTFKLDATSGVVELPGLKANSITSTSLAATAIDGMTITGATIQTDNTPVSGASARGIKLTSAELAGYDTTGQKNFSLTSAGVLAVRGEISSGSVIKGATLQGAGIQTDAATNRGVKITSTGVSAYDGSGSMTFKLDGTTGVVELPGLKANSITGDMIAGKTITVKNLLVADFDNLATIDEVNGTTISSYGQTMVSAGFNKLVNDSGSFFMFTDQRGPVPFVVGDTLYFEFTAKATSATTASFSAYTYDLLGGNISNSVTVNISATAAVVTGSLPITNVIANAKEFVLGLASVSNKGIQVKAVKVYKMAQGKLIVDGAIDGKTITGATIQTVATASRGIKLTSTELAGYDTNGVKNFSLTSAGALALTGAIQSGSTITGTQVTGSSGIQTSTSATAGVKINNQGIVAYDGSNTMTFRLDATTGYLELPGIKANSINGDRLVAGSVTTDRLVVGDMTNWVIDPYMTGSGKISGATYLTASATAVSAGAPYEKIAQLNSRDNVESPAQLRPVAAGETFYAEAWVRADATANKNIYLGMWLQSDDGTNNWNTSSVLTPSTSSWSTPAAAQSGWVKLTGAFTIPATVVAGKPTTKARAWVQIGGSTAPELVGWFITGWVMRRQADVTTIADGVITTNKITASGIDGGKITAGTLTATQMKGKSITVDKLVVSSTDNLIVEADFGNGGSSWGTLNANKAIIATAGRGSLPALRVTGSTALQTVNNLSNRVTVGSEDRFRGSAYIKSSVAAASGVVKLGLKAYTTATASTNVVIATSPAVSAGVYTLMEGYSPALPANTIAVEFYIDVQNAATGTTLDIDYVAVTRAADGRLVVDGAIDGKTITGALIRTATTNNRVQLDSLGLRAFDSLGNETVTISALDGTISATGQMNAYGQSKDWWTNNDITVRSVLGNKMARNYHIGYDYLQPGVYFERQDGTPQTMLEIPQIYAPYHNRLAVRSAHDLVNQATPNIIGVSSFETSQYSASLGNKRYDKTVNEAGSTTDIIQQGFLYAQHNYAQMAVEDGLGVGYSGTYSVNVGGRNKVNDYTGTGIGGQISGVEMRVTSGSTDPDPSSALVRIDRGGLIDIRSRVESTNTEVSITTDGSGYLKLGSTASTGTIFLNSTSVRVTGTMNANKLTVTDQVDVPLRHFTSQGITSYPPNATVWGPGIFVRDASKSFNDSFISFPANDQMKFEEAGLYLIFLSLRNMSTSPSNARVLLQNYNRTSTITAQAKAEGGVWEFSITHPNYYATAGEILTWSYAQNSGGTQTWDSQLFVTKLK